MSTPAGAVGRDGSSGVQLAEIVAAIGLAADLGMGQPVDHVLRSCVISLRLAEEVGASSEDRDACYWATLLMLAGCTAVSFEMSIVFGDDIDFRSSVAEVGASTLALMRFILGRAGADRNLLGRTKVRVDLLRTKMSTLEGSFHAHCAVGMELARRLGLGEAVVTSLRHTFAQWNGKGLPMGVGGTDILLPIRIAALANIVEVADRRGGADETVRVARDFGGKDLDPHLVSAWCDRAPALLDGLEEASSLDAVIARQPPRAAGGPLAEAELDDALDLLADYGDLKSPWFTGHSRGVASLAVAAGRSVRLPDAELVALRRAALVHDIGRNGVPNNIWDKPGPLTAAEFERVRLHAYYTDRVIRRAGKLADLAATASAAHERGTGSGYPKGISLPTVTSLGRIPRRRRRLSRHDRGPTAPPGPVTGRGGAGGAGGRSLGRAGRGRGRRRAGSRRSSGAAQAHRAGRAHDAGDGGARPRGAGRVDQGGGVGPPDLPQDGGEPHRAHLHQDRRGQPGRGGHVRHAARPRPHLGNGGNVGSPPHDVWGTRPYGHPMRATGPLTPSTATLERRTRAEVGHAR